MTFLAGTSWDFHWRADRLASPVFESGGDLNAVQALWAGLANGLAPGASVLDLGCGNGFVGFVIAQTGAQSGRSFEQFGVDKADIAPSEFATEQREVLAEITFHGKTDMENLPFDEALFNAVVAQYAVEYGDSAAILDRVAQLLKPGGRVQFLVHAKDGQIANAARTMAEQASYIRRNSRIIEHVEDAIQAAWQIERDGNPPNRQSRQKVKRTASQLNDALKRTQAKFKGNPGADDLNQLLLTMARAYRDRKGFRSVIQLKEWLAVNLRNIENIEMRMNAIGKYAVTEAGAAAMVERLTAAGLGEARFRRYEIGAAADLAGWLVSAIKH